MEPKRGATWQILVPHRSRTDLLINVAECCRALPTDDARVTRQLLLDELANGTAVSAGELLDTLEKASAPARRALRLGARARAGLEHRPGVSSWR
jgi:hypothetical protein